MAVVVETDVATSKRFEARADVSSSVQRPAPCHCDLRLNVRMHQKIDQPWGLSVHGTGVVRAEPEIAQIAVAVDVVEREADAAFADARRSRRPGARPRYTPTPPG